MSSTNKSPHLNLNLWLGTDKPKKDDFNSDNEKIDTAFHQHVTDAVSHISAEERQKYLRSPMVVGSYTGDGKASRHIELGFRPAFGCVFQLGKPVLTYNYGDDTADVFFAVVSSSGSMMGAEPDASGLTVKYQSSYDMLTGLSAQFNAPNQKYAYIAFR